MSSNARNEPLINPYHNSETDTYLTLIHDRKTSLTTKVNTNYRDILVRGFWLQNTNCIVDIRICNVNQPFYLLCYSTARG